jgi:hypothetical protein
MVITNHTYDTQGLFSKKTMSGGSGLKYAASLILFLSKKKEKEGSAVVGDVIHCRIEKSRITRPFKQVDVLLNYETGLDKYYDLTELGLKQGVFKEGAGKRFEFPNGKKTQQKKALREPEKWFTPEVLDLLDQAAQREFLYGGSDEIEGDV